MSLLPSPLGYRMPNSVPWSDPDAPYTSSHAIRLNLHPYHRPFDKVDVVKVQYAIELEKRLREAVKRIADLEADIESLKTSVIL